MEGPKGGREASTERGESDGRTPACAWWCGRREAAVAREGGRRHLRLAAACTGTTSRLSPSSRRGTWSRGRAPSRQTTRRSPPDHSPQSSAPPPPPPSPPLPCQPPLRLHWTVRLSGSASAAWHGNSSPNHAPPPAAKYEVRGGPARRHETTRARKRESERERTSQVRVSRRKERWRRDRSQEGPAPETSATRDDCASRACVLNSSRLLQNAPVASFFARYSGLGSTKSSCDTSG